MQAASLPATAGWHWVLDGFRLFRKQPLAMFTWAMAISLLLSIALNTPPFGPLIALLLMPTITLMTLSACKHVEADRVMLPSMWIKPLKQPGVFKRMFLMGIAYASAALIAGLVSFLPFTRDLVEGLRAAAVTDSIVPFLEAARVPLAIFAVLYLIIAGLFWHAPALKAWHGTKLVQALFFSGIACWRNKWAFLVYGFAWLAVFMGLDLITGILVFAGVPLTFASTLKMPFTIAAAGVMYCSFYPAYTSVFGGGEYPRGATQQPV
jgi:hypothetical protein